MGKPRNQLPAKRTNNSSSFLKILEKLICGHPICHYEHEANRYLDHCHNEADIPRKLRDVFSEKDPYILEFFLRGIKNKNFNEIAIPNSFMFGEKINSLTYCVLFGDPGLLTTLLQIIGSIKHI